ncbi:MAG TPA: pyruvate dehydrogenase (acetyl-transferring) E1 component subunit alpha [Thermoplasmata archaeon]
MRAIAEETLLRIIDLDGTYDSKLEPKLPPDLLKQAYRALVLVRVLDNRMLSLQRQGRIGFYVPSTGEEACQIGSAMALEKRDWVFPAYREPGGALWRGFPLELLIAQAYGNAKDAQKGRQMPSHIGSREVNLVTVSSPVGTQIPQAVGAAWAAKIRKDDVVTLTFFGDGATSEGDFHAAMNFAGVFKTPTIFFCKNNQWAISVPLSRQTAAKTLAQKAQAYGFEGVRVDGNDVLAVYSATKAAVDKARAGGGPTMIEAVTYRMGPHSSSDDPTRYRPKDEVESWGQRDPIERMRKYLELKGLWSRDADDKLRAELDDLLQTTIKEVERHPPPPIESLFTDVYAELTPQLKEQMEAYLASGERRRPEMLDKFPL